MMPSCEAPMELRPIHPAPPTKFKAYGKSFNLATLEKPYRKFQKEDPAKFAELVKEGGNVYIQNCQYCHGDKLDGNGPYASGLNPTPLNFQDVGTIAQLQESFLFWRIATGGPGLPAEASPWISAMPVWEHFLTEEEVWKVTMFIYDYTGYVPRVMKEARVPSGYKVAGEKGTGYFSAWKSNLSPSMAYPPEKGPVGAKAVYDKRWAWCHGWGGGGGGAAT